MKSLIETAFYYVFFWPVAMVGKLIIFCVLISVVMSAGANEERWPW